jgi:hypothetical protein
VAKGLESDLQLAWLITEMKECADSYVSLPPSPPSPHTHTPPLARLIAEMKECADSYVARDHHSTPHAAV